MAGTKKKKENADKNSFEGALASLEGVIGRLESDGLTLDEALACFEEGVRLMRHCDVHLKNARGRLIELKSGMGENKFITEILGESLESFTGGENTEGGEDEYG